MGPSVTMWSIRPNVTRRSWWRRRLAPYMKTFSFCWARYSCTVSKEGRGLTCPSICFEYWISKQKIILLWTRYRDIVSVRGGSNAPPDGRRNLVDPYKLKGDLTQKSNVFYIDRGVPWDVLGGSGRLSRPSVKIRCRAYYHFKRVSISGICSLKQYKTLKFEIPRNNLK